MSKLVITRGLSGSGKTTYARKWVAEDRENRVRVNRDDLRKMIDDGEFIKGVTEKRIVEIRDAIIKRALRSGYDVICDDTNLPSRVARDLRKIAVTMNAEFEVVDFTDVEPLRCVGYNLLRLESERVPDEVIWDMYNRYLKGRSLPLGLPDEPVGAWAGPEPYAGTPGKPKTVIVDVDGTVALHNGRDPYNWQLCSDDIPNQPVIDLVKSLWDTDQYSLLFFSGRNDQSYNDTHSWLEKHVGPIFAELHMRKDGDERPDYIIKTEMFDEFARDQYDVKMAIDDRNSVVEKCWRAMGILTLHIADGDF